MKISRPNRRPHHRRGPPAWRPGTTPVRLVVDDRVPVVVGHPQEQGVAGDAGVGDEHLDRPERGLHLGECRLHLGGVGHVALHAEHTGGYAPAAIGGRDPVSPACNRSAIARPMPLLPPVTRTVRDAPDFSGSLVVTDLNLSSRTRAWRAGVG